MKQPSQEFAASAPVRVGQERLYYTGGCVPVRTVPTACLTAFGPRRLLPAHQLAPYTTFGIGGPADWFLDAVSSDEIVTAVRAAALDGLPVTVLGGGSNVLAGDRGIRGLVLRPRATGIERVAPDRARAEAGVSINGLVRWAIREGLGGIEAWAGTPGTVGGAIVGNAHWAGREIGGLVEEVALLEHDGTVRVVAAGDMEFGYDRSRLQRTGEILLRATFVLTPGESPDALRATARASLLLRKRTQPLRVPSAGCIFQNPMPGVDAVPEGLPWSAGALIDRAGLKGRAIGGARVSPVHANFIVNEGGATARDVCELIEACREAVRRRFGVALREEIVRLGEF